MRQYKSSFVLFFPENLADKRASSAAFLFDNTTVSLAHKSLPAPK